MWLIISSLSTQNLHLLFCYFLFIFVLTYLVFMTLFSAAIKSDSVCLIELPLAMFKFSGVRFRMFVAWNIQTITFLPIFVFWLFFICWYLCCLYCFWSVCCLRVFSSMHRRYLQFWLFLFFLLFLTHIVCEVYLCDVMPYASSGVFLFSGPFV